MVEVIRVKANITQNPSTGVSVPVQVGVCLCVCFVACKETDWTNFHTPVVVFEARPPVGRPQEGLQRTGQVDEQVTHEEEPDEET